MKVVMIGATGAVGTSTVQAIALMGDVKTITTLGRRPIEIVQSDKLTQHHANIGETAKIWLSQEDQE